jgi:hypothetical protein
MRDGGVKSDQRLSGRQVTPLHNDQRMAISGIRETYREATLFSASHQNRGPRLSSQKSLMEFPRNWGFRKRLCMMKLQADHGLSAAAKITKFVGYPP